MPPFFVHLDFDIMLTPWPLQEFLPLQAFSAVLQAPWPLQALTPTQAIFFEASASETVTKEPAANKVAAASASEAPERAAIFMKFILSQMTMEAATLGLRDRSTGHFLACQGNYAGFDPKVSKVLKNSWQPQNVLSFQGL